MKVILIRSALALSIAAALSACGGGDDEEYTVKGTVTGIVYPGAVLTTNGMEVALAPPTTPGAAVSFEFPKKLKYGDVYNVIFAKTPDHQKNCGSAANTIANYNDTAGRLSDINITLACDVNSYIISGKVSGLTADGLVIANGSTTGTLTITKPTNTTPFEYTMPAVNYGVTYSITVITQPTGQTCTVANGVGTMGEAAVSNVDITCVNNPA